MAFVVDENGNSKTTLNVEVKTLHDVILEGKDIIPLRKGGVVTVPQGTKELTPKAEAEL